MRIKNFATGETLDIDRSDYTSDWRSKGFHIVADDEPLKGPPEQDPLGDLIAQAKRLGIAANRSWKAETIQARIDEARAKAEDPDASDV